MMVITQTGQFLQPSTRFFLFKIRDDSDIFQFMALMMCRGRQRLSISIWMHTDSPCPLHVSSDGFDQVTVKGNSQDREIFGCIFND